MTVITLLYIDIIISILKIYSLYNDTRHLLYILNQIQRANNIEIVDDKLPNLTFNM